MDLPGHIISALVGIPFLAAIALLVTWAALQVGMHTVTLATGRLEPNAPARKWWEKNEIVALFGVIAPIPGLFVEDAALVQLIVGNPFVGVTSIGIVTGLVLGLAGFRRTNWVISSATAVFAGGLWLFLYKMPYLWMNATLVVTYAVAAGATCYFYVRAFQVAVGASDQPITDLRDADITDSIRHAVEILVSDSKVLSTQPKARPTSFVSGFLHKQLNFTALAHSEGLYLRIPAPGSDVPEVDPGYPVRRRAVWLLVSWENLEIIKFDRIIGHTELRLRLRNSGYDLVLEHPPKKITKYLPAGEDVSRDQQHVVVACG